MTTWTEEQKQKVLAIAEAAGAAEAERATGIPAGTIRSWIHRLQRNGNSQSITATQRNTKKLGELQQRIMQQAIAEAGEYIVNRLKSLANELYGLAEDGVKETRAYMKAPGTKDRDSAAWLRSVVGAMHYGIQDAQLLSGKPTARPEVTNRHEYDITQRIIADPEALDLAEQLLRRTAGRDAGSLRVYGERGPLDTV